MARVVCVHGVAQQRETGNTILREWVPALCGGVKLAGGELLEAAVQCAFYGDLFRSPGRHLAAGDPVILPEDLDEFEQELLLAWWVESARVDARVIAPDARTLVRAPRSVQAGLRALSGSRFFAGIGERALLGDLRQVRRYLHEPDIRQAVQNRLAGVMEDDTRVLVGHSLGSIVAYEGLFAHPEWPVRALVTLGSPLAIPNLVFHRLQPAPGRDPKTGTRYGYWPGTGRTWTNVADEGDVVALVKDLRLAFGPGVDSWLVDNGARAHNAIPYLTAVETGRAVLAGLTER